MKKEFLLLGLALCCAGCTTVEKDAFIATTNVETSPIMFEPLTEVIGDNVVGRATDASVFWGLMSTESPDEFVSAKSSSSRISSALESAAIADACKKSGADIILDPKFTINDYSGFLGFSNETTAKVEGVPAKIIGAKEVPLEEVCKQIVLQRQQESMFNLGAEDGSIVVNNNTLSAKFGTLKSDESGGEYDDLKFELALNLSDSLSLVGAFHKLKGKDYHSLEANIYDLDFRCRLLNLSNCSLSVSLGGSYIDYECSYYQSYWASYSYYVTRYYLDWYYDWDYEWVRDYTWEWNERTGRYEREYYWYKDWYSRKRYYYNSYRDVVYQTYRKSYLTSKSDSALSPMFGVHFKYENDVVYLAANFKYIKAYEEDTNLDEYLYEDKLSLELDIGLCLTNFLRLDVSYMNDFGKEKLSGVYGGVTFLF